MPQKKKKSIRKGEFSFFLIIAVTLYVEYLIKDNTLYAS